MWKVVDSAKHQTSATYNKQQLFSPDTATVIMKRATLLKIFMFVFVLGYDEEQK